MRHMLPNKGGRPKTSKTEEEIKRALIETEGLQYLAAEKLDISPQALGERIQNSNSLLQLRDNLLEKRLDIAEQRLMDLIRGGIPTGAKPCIQAIMFFLKSRGKHRGYTQEDTKVVHLSEIKEFLAFHKDK